MPCIRRQPGTSSSPRARNGALCFSALLSNKCIGAKSHSLGGRPEHPDRGRSGGFRPDGDKQTINLRYEPPIRFKPADFGLEAGSCRDLILRLRDDHELRSRLPEFDSARDLAIAPVVAGEMSDPGL